MGWARQWSKLCDLEVGWYERSICHTLEDSDEFDFFGFNILIPMLDDHRADRVVGRQVVEIDLDAVLTLQHLKALVHSTAITRNMAAVRHDMRVPRARTGIDIGRTCDGIAGGKLVVTLAAFDSNVRSVRQPCRQTAGQATGIDGFDSVVDLCQVDTWCGSADDDLGSGASKAGDVASGEVDGGVDGKFRRLAP